MHEKVFQPDLAEIFRSIVRQQGCPECERALARASEEALEHLRNQTGREDIGFIDWMLRELLLNAAEAVARNSAVERVEQAGLVSIIVRVHDNAHDFEVMIRNKGKPSRADHREITRRFADHVTVRQEIETMRRKHTTAQGNVCIPTTAGAGGLAVLECIRVLRERKMCFEYWTEDAPVPATVFRIGSHPSSEENRSA